MLNYKPLTYSCLFVSIAGCMQQDDHFFHSLNIPEKETVINYKENHKLTLQVMNLSKKIDESGFSPTLLATFTLDNQNKSIWPQAWIAFMVNIRVNDKLLASMTESGSLHQNSLNVEINQTLPKFGVKNKDVSIDITPISWMPTYPLIINTP